MRVSAARAWAVIIGLALAWAAAGPWLAHQRAVVGWLARAGAVADFAAPALFIVTYTILGLTGPSKWWRDPIGMTLVLFAGAAVAQSAVLAWVFIFGHGALAGPALVWAYLGGLIGAPLIILWRTWMWISISRQGRQASHDDPRPRGGRGRARDQGERQ